MYGYLLALKENLKSYLDNAPHVSDLARCLQNELNTRLPMLNTNPLMICAVFLDRRYSSELNSTEKALAMRTLVKIWEDIKEENKKSDNSEVDESNENENAFKFAENSEVLDNYFKSKGIALQVDNNDGTPNFSLSNLDMYGVLRNFDESVGRQHPSKNVLDFWEESKETYPEIYLLSLIINTVPPTQASTERCFSALTFIYDSKRTKLSLFLLEQILLIRLNKELVSTIFAEDLESIKNKNK